VGGDGDGVGDDAHDAACGQLAHILGPVECRVYSILIKLSVDNMYREDMEAGMQGCTVQGRGHTVIG
jgi:hypothetical protein